MLRNRKNQAGDTLIEVLLAMGILSLVIVGGSTLMNFGLRNVQNAVEHTQVRNLMAGQAEVLRYLRDKAQPEGTDPATVTWRDELLKDANGYVTETAASSVANCEPSAGKKAFYVEATFNGEAAQPTIAIKDYTGTVAGDTPPYAVPGRGMWIEAVKSTSAPEYIDFHLRSCWMGIGTGATQQQTNTIVRLATK